VPRLDEVRRKLQTNHNSDQSADDHMDPLLHSFRALSKAFPHGEEVKHIVERETGRANEWIAEHTDDEPEDKPKRTLGDVDTLEGFKDARNIFEDADA
jgi:hypothetical protein